MKFFLAFLAALLAASAQAQPSDKFRSLDRNGDGFLTRDEMGAIRDYDAAFAEADDNRDGRLNPDEFFKAESTTDVHVESGEGRVLLSGFVDSEAQKQRALRVASRVGGVREVRDGLNVR